MGINSPIDIDILFYDSFITPSKYRFSSPKLKNIKSCYTDLKCIFNNVNSLIQNSKDKLETPLSYLLMLCILHTEMHIEAIFFTYMYTNRSMILPLRFTLKSENIISNIDFIHISGKNKFIQGINRNNKQFTFDNEMPSFYTDISDFYVSKYFITQNNFIEFIKAGGYNNKKYWSNEGWEFIKTNGISLPLYFKKIHNRYYFITNDIHINISKYNLPICYISYYEIEAYICWLSEKDSIDYHIISETQWEYIYKYYNSNKVNVDYKNFIQSVTGNEKNSMGYIYGNVWCWCKEPIYPYNGFIIDPIYREMSYPHFGNKYIVKGSSYLVPKYLSHDKYRNAQPKECRFQPIGFKIVYYSSSSSE